MSPSIRPIEQVLLALSEAQVRYLVVGGVAVVLHGRLRTTADLDLWVELEEKNLKRAMTALSSLGYRPRAPVRFEDFANPQARDKWVQEKGLVVFSVWHADSPLEVDLFVRDPMDFPQAYSRALVVALEATEIHVVGLNDLLIMKRSIGRPQDLDDVRALEALRDAGEGHGRNA
jgi:predicted nucleotidyltransferase